jgi:4'-phosphopantetheinyl transferase EntD
LDITTQRENGRSSRAETTAHFPSPFGNEFAFVTLAAWDDLEFTLDPAEERLLSPRANEKRKAEFRLGRSAAHLALKQLGISSPPPVLQGPRREPLWPEGVVGSITHCESFACASVARRPAASAIGIDLENAAAVPPGGLLDWLCHDSELDWVSCDGRRTDRLAMIFSAKEAVFKAFYPLCGRFFDFKDVKLAWMPLQKKFQGELLIDLSVELESGFRFEVGAARSGDFILAHLVLGPGIAMDRLAVDRSAVSATGFCLEGGRVC